MKIYRILLIVEQCNPEWASVPLVGYRFFEQISSAMDVTLVTHVRNKVSLEKIKNQNKIIYISQSRFVTKYYSLIKKLTDGKNINWPLQHFLNFPVYSEFNRKVYKQFKTSVENGAYDLVHAITPMMPRYPVKLAKACRCTPFLLGPVNGGVPFPKGFDDVARMENAHFNFIRHIGRILIPGYYYTYKNADYIYAGSSYTLHMLSDLFKLDSSRIGLFFENGVDSSFFLNSRPHSGNRNVELLFVGRLVPYKGADMLIRALGGMDAADLDNIHLTIVGDGPEKDSLMELSLQLVLANKIEFTGWVSQSEILQFYQRADIFCFPSIREFGGAVVLEAMAAGLPCIVVNNGGIAEYMTDNTGFKIDPVSRAHIIQELAVDITKLVRDDDLRKSMSRGALSRSREFSWTNKQRIIFEKYQQLIEGSAKTASGNH